jgi:hypothetical protein
MKIYLFTTADAREVSQEACFARQFLVPFKVIYSLSLQRIAFYSVKFNTLGDVWPLEMNLCKSRCRAFAPPDAPIEYFAYKFCIVSTHHKKL